VQACIPPDYHARVVFCQLLLRKCVIDTQFVANILFTDEAEFTRDGIVNFHNTRALVEDSFLITVASRHQHQFSISAWGGILGDQLLGLVVLPNRLTGTVYHCFLVTNLPVLLEHVPLHQQQHMLFMHDGAAPHFLQIVRWYLNQTFSAQWIRCGGQVNWPA
jgi:hypothetical protein